jgi:tryptophan synthase alpha subunit
MSRIKEKFSELDAKNEKALISYIMAGFPNERATLSAVKGLVKGGADIIELGFPFSDPLADGPVIQHASTVSLEKGTKINNFFNLVKKIRKITDTPLVLMTYTNILYVPIFCMPKDITSSFLRLKKLELTGLFYQICQLRNQQNTSIRPKEKQIPYF